MFDSDKAAVATNRMWLRVARLLDKASEIDAKAGYTSSAIKNARAADACYWQATGDGDAINLKDILSSEPKASGS